MSIINFGGIWGLGGGGVDPADAMLKSVYDVNDRGFVDQAGRLVFQAQAFVGLTKGQPVYPALYSVPNGAPIVDLSDSDLPDTLPAIGITDQAATATEFPIVVVAVGPITGLDTSLLSVGTELFVGPTGGLNPIRPADYTQAAALVTRSDAVSGEIFVNMASGVGLTRTRIISGSPSTIPNAFNVIILLQGSGVVNLPLQNASFTDGIKFWNRSGADKRILSTGPELIDGSPFFNIPDQGTAEVFIDVITPGWYGGGGTATTSTEFNIGSTRSFVGAL